MSKSKSRSLLFEVQSALGYKICITRSYWFKILRDKHPVMRGKEPHVQRTLAEPWKCVGASMILMCISIIADTASGLSVWSRAIKTAKVL